MAGKFKQIVDHLLAGGVIEEFVFGGKSRYKLDGDKLAHIGSGGSLARTCEGPDVRGITIVEKDPDIVVKQSELDALKAKIAELEKRGK